jgi:hypothetical protein
MKSTRLVDVGMLDNNNNIVRVSPRIGMLAPSMSSLTLAWYNG